ncbi:MAG TPA: hypothetical protein PLO41_20960 [Rubrivivax sp.]|nr:hypothetical protein [Rubrivivax sp.]
MKLVLTEPARADEAERDRRIQRQRALVEDGLASGPAAEDAPADAEELMAIALADIA